jgi:hypothetical protein
LQAAVRNAEDSSVTEPRLGPSNVDAALFVFPEKPPDYNWHDNRAAGNS